jgi:glycosyltransferase involved in cell wall biosynthesis
MKIGIDARFLSHPQRGGFKTYTQSLVSALAQVDTANTYVLYLDRPLESEAGLPRQANVELTILPGTAPYWGMMWREQVSLARAAARDRVDVLHSPSLTAPLLGGTRSVVTIHDMIWHSRDQFAADRRRSLRRLLINSYLYYVPGWAASRARAVITVSQAARKAILDQRLVAEDRLHVTLEAASPFFQRRPEAEIAAHLAARFKLRSGFLLAIGSADPRKNVALAVEAYSRLPEALRNAHPLVIVWTHQSLAATITRQIDSLGLTRQVSVLQSVSDEDLRALYNAAAAFLFPSRYEGFGLPLLEAMACGAPVLAADNSSIPEIVGQAGWLLPTDDAPAWIDALERLLRDPVQRQHMADQGLARAGTFSWQRCAQETVAVYQQAAHL